MGQEIEKFDPSKLADQVRDRIQSTFAMLVPDEAWNEMVQNSIESFCKDTVIKNQWGERTGTKKSQLEQIVHEELEKNARANLAKYFESDEWRSFWNGQSIEIGSKLADLVKAAAPELLSGLLTQSMMSLVNQLKYQLMQR